MATINADDVHHSHHRKLWARWHDRLKDESKMHSQNEVAELPDEGIVMLKRYHVLVNEPSLS